MAQEMFTLNWHPGQEKPGGLPEQAPRKSAPCHSETLILTFENSPGVLPRAERPGTLKRCVVTLKDRYVCEVPLLPAPRTQHASCENCEGCDLAT
jgi:hypothetical protein